jgi:transposase
MQIRNKQIKHRLWELGKFLLNQYKEQSVQKEKDYALYEKKFKKRIKKVIKELTTITNEATRNLKIYRGRGRRPQLKPNDKLRLILIHQIFGKSNRMMSYMLLIFSLMTGIDVSYKTIERLYSDEETEIALHNLLILILNKKGIREIDACGDATGYGLFISKHYLSYAEKLKDNAKESKNTKKAFVYKFALMDLSTRMYVCFGSSLISEKQAFDSAMQMLKETNIKIKSIRLDRYYSFPTYVKQFPDSTVYIIPRKNSRLGHGEQWLNTMRRFLEDTMTYLGEYFKRVNSENGFAQDKKMFGDKVRQKRDDRIDTVLLCRVVWHNLLYLFG